MKNKTTKIYYVKDLTNQNLVNQFDRSKKLLNDSDEVSENFNVFQGQLVYYLYFDHSRNELAANIGIALNDSYVEQNNVIICPLLLNTNPNIAKLGINIGKLINLNDKHDYIAAIPGIKSISKNYIRVSDMLKSTWIDENLVIKIVKNYRNVLANIIHKNGKITKCLCC